jgi:hypothetical protein
MASRMRSAEGSAAPPTAPHVSELEEAGGAEPARQVAKVRLLVGKSSHAHGMRFVFDRPQTVVDDELIEEFKNDGNFSVEMVPVTGGRPARQR